MAKEKNNGLHWETGALLACAAGLWVTGFDQKWFGFGPWVKEFPTWYPPPQSEFLTGAVLTGIGLGFSFSSLRHPGIINKILGWSGFFYFYLHVLTLGYMANPDLFIWRILLRLLH